MCSGASILNSIKNGSNNTKRFSPNLSVSEVEAAPGCSPEVMDLRLRGKEHIYNPASERQIHFWTSVLPRERISHEEEFLDRSVGIAGQ